MIIKNNTQINEIEKMFITKHLLVRTLLIFSYSTTYKSMTLTSRIIFK